MNPQEVRELVALISWLGTFEQFIYQIFDGADVLRDGNEGELAQLALNSLENPKISLAILEVAKEVCAPGVATVPSNATNQEIWKGILQLSGTKGLVKALERPDTLPLCALSNLLRSAVTNTDLSKRRVYIERIMSLSKGVQKTLMTLIERSKKTPRKKGSSSAMNSSSGRSARSKSVTPASKSRSSLTGAASKKSSRRSTTPTKRSRSVTPTSMGNGRLLCGALSLPTKSASSSRNSSSNASSSAISDSHFSISSEENAQKASLDSSMKRSRRLSSTQKDGQQQQQNEEMRQKNSAGPQRFSSPLKETKLQKEFREQDVRIERLVFSNPPKGTAPFNSQAKQQKRQSVGGADMPIEGMNSNYLSLNSQSSASQSDVRLALAPTDSSDDEPNSKAGNLLFASSSSQTFSSNQLSQQAVHLENSNFPDNQERSRSNFMESHESPVPQKQVYTPQPTPQKEIDSDFFSPPSTLQSPMQLEAYVHELREKNKSLESILQSYRKREAEITQETEQSEGKLRKEMMKLEKRALQREEDLRAVYDNEVGKLKKELSKAKEECEKGEKAQRQLNNARDEIELMHHNQGMLADATERLRMYKERLDELTDVREALQREEEAHNKAIEECVRLDNELKTLHPLKRQLEDYKHRAVDCEFKLSECQNQLSKMERDAKTFEETKSVLMEEIKAQKQETDELRTRIQTEREMKRGNGVGEGMSELNPELKEEIVKLRNENNRLRAFVDKRQDDFVQKLEEDIDDSKRLVDKYKGEYQQTKNDLAERDAELHLAKAELNKTQDDAAALTLELEKMTDQSMRYKEEYLQTRRALEETESELAATQDKLLDTEKMSADIAYQLEKMTEEAAEYKETYMETKSDLEKTESDLSKTEEEVISLTEKVKQLAEESNTNSKNYEQANARLKEKESELVAEKNKVANLKVTVTQYTEEASKFKDECIHYKCELKDAQGNLMEANKNLDHLNREIIRWKENSENAENRLCVIEQQLNASSEEADSLENALREANERNLDLKNKAAQWQKISEEAESVSKIRLETINELQKKLDSAASKLAKSEEGTTELRNAVSTMEDELKKAATEKTSLKDELSASKQELRDSRDSVTALKSNENDLRTENITLKKELTNVQKQLEEERRTRLESTEESQRALEATREVLNAKAKKELAELQANMNQLLEDERVAYRQKAEAASTDAKEIEQKWRKQYLDLQERSTAALNAARQEAQKRLEQAENEHKTSMEKARKQAKESYDDLLKRGTSIVNETKKKTEREFMTLREKREKLQSKLDDALNKKAEIEAQYRGKLNSMKQKLQFTAEQINELNDEQEELQQKIRNLDREKLKLEEENERYRRQLGGRYGADGKVQGQLDKLQKEYNQILDENRNLKKKIQRGLTDPSISPTGASTTSQGSSSFSYSRGGVTGSALSELRKEYEATIEALNDEKRELVMKNSASITEVQKAEQTVWERDQEVDRLKMQITSLRLEMQRAEIKKQQITPKNELFDENSGINDVALKNQAFLAEKHRVHSTTPPSTRKALTPRNRHTNETPGNNQAPSSNKHTNDHTNVFSFAEDNNENSTSDPYTINPGDVRRQPQKQNQTKQQGSIVDNAKAATAGGGVNDAQPECKQS